MGDKELSSSAASSLDVYEFACLEALWRGVKEANLDARQRQGHSPRERHDG